MPIGPIQRSPLPRARSDPAATAAENAASARFSGRGSDASKPGADDLRGCPLDRSNDRRYPALGLTPQQQRQRTLQALVSQVEALTRQSPVLMIFEDAHWTDPTSLEVLGLVVERIQTLPVLLIVTFRPEFDPPWIGRPHVSALTIDRLTPSDVVSM